MAGDRLSEETIYAHIGGRQDGTECVGERALQRIESAIKCGHGV